jgi:agmatine deiminase
MPIATGYYSVRVHAIGTTADFGGSAVFTVAVQMPPPAPSITVNGSANPVVAEGAALAIAVANGPGTLKDWVGLTAAGAPDTSYITWVYLSGSHTAPNVGMTSAIVSMAAPSVDASYEARFYLNDGFTVLARTAFTVRGTALSSPQPPQSSAQ